MPVTSTITVQDPIDAYELFAASRAAAGVRLFDGRWDLHDFGAVHMLQTLPYQKAFALVSVRFPVQAGALLPTDLDRQEPAGYVQLAFDTDGTDREGGRRLHRELTHRIGAWLTNRRLRWCWAYEDQPWSVGYPGPTGIARVTR